MASSSKSAAVRARLQHPVIDGDGHWLEPLPIFLDYLKDVAGQSVVDKFVKRAKDVTWYDLAPEERMRRRLHRPTWWGEPASTLDRATAMIPRLFYERLDAIGLDFCVLYTSLGLFFIGNPDEEIRRATARAVNRMNAELFKPYAHRITPAAVVPVHTPDAPRHSAAARWRPVVMPPAAITGVSPATAHTSGTTENVPMSPV